VDVEAPEGRAGGM